MFCIPHFVFNCCTFRWVEGKGTRQSTSILFVLVMYLFHYLCITYLYQGNVFVVVFQMWCRAYAPHGFSEAVTTNNGVEALNKSPKSFYLTFSGTRRFSSMLETIVCEFVPEQLLSYSRLHFIYSSKCKTYNPAVPAFLKDRPRSLVIHCLNSTKAASSYSKEIIEVLGKESFKVKRETTSAWYNVEFCNSEKYLSC